MKQERIGFTRISSNKKTGQIPVTISPRSTCPNTCPFKNNGCYAENFPLKLHWNKISNGEKGLPWVELLRTIRKLPKGQLWRHNQAGDLPGKGNALDKEKLDQLTRANKGKKGFTYTHKFYDDCGRISEENIEAIRRANKEGFTISLSATGVNEALLLKNRFPGLPIVTALPEKWLDNYNAATRIEGRKIYVCPASNPGSRINNCSECRLCSHPDRSYIIGFPVHGGSKKKAEAALN